MKAEDFAGKLVGEVINENTIFLDKKRYKEGFDVNKVQLSEHPGDFTIDSSNGMTVVGDHRSSGVIICFKDNIPVAVFIVYELCFLALNAKRGMVKAQGHETTHDYWFDDNEYYVDYTR